MRSYEGIDNTSARGVTSQEEWQCKKSSESSAKKTMRENQQNNMEKIVQ
jgi:hypothetical protein